MTLLKMAQISAPTIKKEAVEVAALGGAVIVRGMLLSERLELSAMASHLRDTGPSGESESMADQRIGRIVVMHTLARTVILEDGDPVYTAAEWDLFGSDHPEAVFELHRKARELSGYNDAIGSESEGAVEKN